MKAILILMLVCFIQPGQAAEVETPCEANDDEVTTTQEVVVRAPSTEVPDTGAIEQ